MAQPTIHTSFASGEWAPKLRSRVDLQKYHSGAALLKNFYVDYSGGGASTRQGTKFINICKGGVVRVVPFQASVSLSYVLEFGGNYIRFYSNGAPVLEAPVAIQSITGSPVTVNSTANGYNNGDWVFISGAFYIVINATTNTYQLTDLFGNNVLSLSGTQAQRVYTIVSPYAASDLFPNQGTGNPGIKWVQDVTSMIICHPNYPPQILTINTATNWTLSAIAFGPTLGAPTPALVPNITGTGWFYSYVVTSVDNNGQESAASSPATATNVGNINTVNPSNLVITWSAIAGAVSYNVYKASPAFNAAIPAGSQFGFVSNVLGTSYQESYPGTLPDFAQTPPIVASPTVGGNVLTINLVTNANYTQVPVVTIPAPPSGFTATAFASLAVTTLALVTGSHSVIGNPNAGYTGFSPVGLQLLFSFSVTATITGATLVGGSVWTINSIALSSGGSLTSAGAAVPTNPISPFGLTGMTTTGGTPASAYFLNVPSNPLTANATWSVGTLTLIQGGFGYTSAPTPTLSPAGATASTTVSPISSGGGTTLGAVPVGNPRVPGFFQERLVLASPNAGLQSFYLSQPASFFNFNISNPSQSTDAIFGSIISEELNAIKSLITVPTGILALTGSGAWLINGGGGISTANPITPSNVSATPQAFNGANDIRPLKINFDALFVTNKGNYVRSASYNIYANIFIGADISTISNHFFFNEQIVDWTWAEEPFKVVWVVRNDTRLLSLTYVKEQELMAWAQHDTQGGFSSCCSVIESNIGGVQEPNTVDAVYFVTIRTLNGQSFSCIERMADRYFTYGVEDAWSVDCALQTTPVVTDINAFVIGNATAVGNVVTLIIFGSNFTAAMATNNYIFRTGGGIYKITAFTNASQVTAQVVQVGQIIPYTTTANFGLDYTIWQPVTSVGGLGYLAGQSVVGVADGVAVGPFTVSGSGTVTLGLTATKVTLGLQFIPQLQTLPLDLGEPVVEGRRKKITALTLRVADTVGLMAGTTFPNAVTMKDFTLGNLNLTSNTIVSNLFSGDGRIIIDQNWQEAGSYCIQQTLPYPATVLGVMPEIAIGDSYGEKKQ